jgi:hypothetical protein
VGDKIHSVATEKKVVHFLKMKTQRKHKVSIYILQRLIKIIELVFGFRTILDDEVTSVLL